jgi:cytochrome c oxidase assembly factor CtaG
LWAALQAAKQPGYGAQIEFWWLSLWLVVTGAVYLRGFLKIRQTRPRYFSFWRLLCFLSGLGALWLALLSPLDAMNSFLLTAHMAQHMILMMVVPPLVLAGAPVVPLLRGLPRILVRDGLGPLFRLRFLRHLVRFITHPKLGWIAMNASFLAWHVPASYEFALRHPGWHIVEHICFLATSLLFWYPIVLPWPGRMIGPRWNLLPYLVSADLINTALAAFLSFSRHIIYPSYTSAPLLMGVSPIMDQTAAGVLMWVVGSIFYLVPVMWILIRLLSPSGNRIIDSGR